MIDESDYAIFMIKQHVVNQPRCLLGGATPQLPVEFHAHVPDLNDTTGRLMPRLKHPVSGPKTSTHVLPTAARGQPAAPETTNIVDYAACKLPRPGPGRGTAPYTQTCTFKQ